MCSTMGPLSFRAAVVISVLLANAPSPSESRRIRVGILIPVEKYRKPLLQVLRIAEDDWHKSVVNVSTTPATNTLNSTTTLTHKPTNTLMAGAPLGAGLAASSPGHSLFSKVKKANNSALQYPIVPRPLSGVDNGSNITEFEQTLGQDFTAAGKLAHMSKDHQPDVIIGPSYSKAVGSTAKLARYWNTPMVTWFAPYNSLEDRGNYTSLIQIYPPIQKFVSAAVTFIETCKCTLVGVIYEKSNPHEELGLKTVEQAKIDQQIEGYGVRSVQEIEEHLRSLLNKTKTIVFCLSDSLLKDAFIAVESLGMSQNDTQFLIYRISSSRGQLTSASLWREPSLKFKEIFKGYERVTILSLKAPTASLSNLSAIVPLPSVDCVGVPDCTERDEFEDFIGFFYDACMFVLKFYYESKNVKRNRTEAQNVMFDGMTGRVKFDSEGDRDAPFALHQLQRGIWVENPVQNCLSLHSSVVQTGSGTPNGPFNGTWHCNMATEEETGDEGGFRNLGVCEEMDQACAGLISGTFFGSIFLLLLLLLLLLRWRRNKLHEKALQRKSWQVDYKDIEFRKDRPATPAEALNQRRKLVKMHTRMTLSGWEAGEESIDGDLGSSLGVFAPAALYKGKAVVVKSFRFSLTLNTAMLETLKALKEMHHENLVEFIGAAVEPAPNACFLMMYCTKGSLSDVLANIQIKMDYTFNISFMFDIAKGLHHLHKSSIEVHGNLKSTNCVVDSRWVVKLTDFAVLARKESRMQAVEEENGNNIPDVYESLLWTAPELLRLEKSSEGPVTIGTQKADVYSYGIILQEILLRQPPFHQNREDDGVSPKQIVKKVREWLQPPYRPMVNSSGEECSHWESTIQLMRYCWAESPDYRPDTATVLKYVERINGGRKVSFVDNMVQLLEKHAGNLEALVEERTEQLMEEQLRTEHLLSLMLPKPVADSLKAKIPVEPETFESVSIFFSDIVGFTAIASKSTPLQIVNLLNGLYSEFDTILERRDVYKVETIGDAYMCVSGLPTRNGADHSRQIAFLALDVLSASMSFNVDHLHQPLRLRIGLHTGSCVAGVVGHAMPRYCLFGDTVNVASRMESTGEAGKIHISSEMMQALTGDHSGFFIRKLPEKMFVKGRGLLQTYWLTGHETFTAPLPIVNSPGEPEIMKVSSSMTEHQLMTHLKSDTAFADGLEAASLEVSTMVKLNHEGTEVTGSAVATAPTGVEAAPRNNLNIAVKQPHRTSVTSNESAAPLSLRSATPTVLLVNEYSPAADDLPQTGVNSAFEAVGGKEKSISADAETFGGRQSERMSFTLLDFGELGVETGNRHTTSGEGGKRVVYTRNRELSDSSEKASERNLLGGIGRVSQYSGEGYAREDRERRRGGVEGSDGLIPSYDFMSSEGHPAFLMEQMNGRHHRGYEGTHFPFNTQHDFLLTSEGRAIAQDDGRRHSGHTHRDSRRSSGERSRPKRESNFDFDYTTKYLSPSISSSRRGSDESFGKRREGKRDSGVSTSTSERSPRKGLLSRDRDGDRDRQRGGERDRFREQLTIDAPRSSIDQRYESESMRHNFHSFTGMELKASELDQPRRRSWEVGDREKRRSSRGRISERQVGVSGTSNSELRKTTTAPEQGRVHRSKKSRRRRNKVNFAMD